MLGPAGPLHAATDRNSALGLGRSPGLGLALRLGAAMLPLTATVALAIAALPLYRLHLPRRAAAVPPPAASTSAASAAAAPAASGLERRLRVSFGRAGASIGTGSSRVTLRLSAIGYGAALEPVGRVLPTRERERVTYFHAGVAEWYVNKPRGLEQGFTVTRAPRIHVRGPLTLAVSLSGVARASASRSGVVIGLRRGVGPQLSLGELHATDASARTLRSWLELRRGAVMLRVDVHGARLPVRIDPLVQQGGKLTNGSEEPSYFGASVALSGDGAVALIGAPRKAGVAWSFSRAGETWTREQMLTGPVEKGVSEAGNPCGEDKAVEEEEEGAHQEVEKEGCGFGASVAIAKDAQTALVGSPRERRACTSGPECPFQGAAWVFTRKGSAWTPQSVLLGAGEESPGGRFGRAVALSADGSTALVGAPADAGGAGGVWVFKRSGETWTQQRPKLTAGTGPGAFGKALAVSSDGNSALIGAPGEEGKAGAAWLFTRAAETWAQGQKLTGEEELGAARFGTSVALSGGADVALVGGPRDNGRRGAAWSFKRSGAIWSPVEKLTGRGERGGAEFGFSVALSDAGALALVGGPNESSRAGMTWSFTGVGVGEWSPASQRLAVSVPAGDKPRFGHSVALSGDGKVALIGGPRDVDVTGAAWAFAHPSESEEPSEEEKREVEEEAPRVTGVRPAQGAAAGGTPVTISGTELARATEVHFGSSAAQIVGRTNSAITAISPAHAPGTVDVVVLVGKLASATSQSDRFTFLASGGGQGEGAAGVSGSTGAGGTLFYGPVAVTAARCTLSLLSRSVKVSSKGRTPLKLRLSGSGSCRGKLTLSVKIRRAHARPKVRAIAATAFSALAGRTATITLSLNKLGRKLLHDAHGRLSAALAIVRLFPAPVQGRTASIRLTLQRPRAKLPAKH